ncbi:MAG: hypothetical protein HFI70_08120 [Lachnospiraceae bacterium]|nr:hypothetical protein [Lachnospiraceae bacterium]
MKSWKKYLSIAGVLFVLALTAVVTIPVNAETDETSTIPQRVYFGEVSVGGMTQEEAKEAVEEYISSNLNQTVTLQAGKNTVQVPVSQFGISWGNPEIAEEAAGLGKSGNLIARYKAMKDLENEDKVYELSYKADEGMISQVLESNAQTLNTEAKDGGLTRANGAFTVVPGSQGVSINIDDSKEILEKYFSSQWKGTVSDPIELAADVVEPRGSEEELGKVKDLLGGFHTSYSSSGAGRSKNVENGASLINGSVVYPGDTFSVYEAVSPFDAEHGYELAGSYENGTTVETYGGGICQVSTTLYNAVIRAELEITERSNHSMIVGYVDPSADAAIAGTYKDLKFTNNTDAPIYIEGYTEGRELYFNVFGEETRPANREVSFVSETLSTTEPGTQYQASSGHAIGYISQKQSSHTGYTAQLWKVVTVDGVEKSREIFNKSTYKASPRIVVVGTASANPEAVNAMNAAVGSQNEGTIRAAAAQWNDAAQAAAQQAAQQAAEAAAQQAAQQQQQQQQQQPPEGGEKPKDEQPEGGDDKPSKNDKNDKEDEGEDEGDEE